ncbi:hypothetical protein [Streptomyces sp. CC224B]|uniref:hypothetical protein n=1 Tax=Streptomyces sp. CC224B TaxID=3044571 RepID=UPI0024A9FCCD|nr:hypothetical protein [Streptomyces sp. CC224B]
MPPQEAERARQVRLHVEDLMLLMNASKIKKDRFEKGGYPIPLRNFDKAESFFLDSGTHDDVEDNEYFSDVTLDDLGRRINCTVVAPAPEGKIAVHRYITVRRPLMPVSTITRHIVASQRLYLDRRTGIGRTSVQYFGTNSAGNWKSWIDLASSQPLHEVHPAECGALRVTLGVQFGRDYLWYAYLKLPGAEAGVMIPTTPEGARALFRLRDTEEGRSRRTALTHWVGEHQRRIRKDTIDETRTWVREHVRGTAKFTWRGLEGAIYPAPYDLRRISNA